MFRTIVTLATAGACALAVVPSAQAATVTSVPSSVGVVVMGDHPTATVTFQASPGMALARDGGTPLSQTYETAWELVSTDCNGPLSQPGAPVTSCTALLRVFADHPINLGIAPALHFAAIEFDPAGVEPTTTVTLDASVAGGVTIPPAAAARGPSVTSPFVRQSGAATFRITWDRRIGGYVQVMNPRTGRVVRTLPVAAGRSWTARWHGRNAQGRLVRPGAYRMRAVASETRPFVGHVTTVRSPWVTTDVRAAR